MVFNINITWSKSMALLLLILSTYIDSSQCLNGIVFMASVPFVVFLITGRWIKEIKSEINNLKSSTNIN